MTFSNFLLSSFFHQFMCPFVHSSIYPSINCSKNTVPILYSIDLCTYSFIITLYIYYSYWTCVHVHIPIKVHIYVYPIYVYALKKSCTVFRYELKMAVTDSVFVIYLQTKVDHHIPQKALRVSKYFNLIGHMMSCDYYIIRGAM